MPCRASLDLSSQGLAGVSLASASLDDRFLGRERTLMGFLDRQPELSADLAEFGCLLDCETTRTWKRHLHVERDRRGAAAHHDDPVGQERGFRSEEPPS